MRAMHSKAQSSSQALGGCTTPRLVPTLRHQSAHACHDRLIAVIKIHQLQEELVVLKKSQARQQLATLAAL
jgi:hypothetical protein